MVHVTLVNLINVQNYTPLLQCIFQLFEETIDVYVKARLFQLLAQAFRMRFFMFSGVVGISH